MKSFAFMLAALISLCSVTHAATIDLGTAGNAGDWLLTGGGAVDAASFQTNVNRSGAIAITSNALRTGSFVTGGQLGSFDGWWVAKNEFVLPGNVAEATLNFSGFYANDRGILRLNGVEIGSVDHLGGTGNGLLRIDQAGTDQPFTFTGVTSGSINTGFLIGQTNVLEIIVNNTGETAITAPTRTFDSDGDATTAFLVASVNTVAVPEPCSIGCLLVGTAGLLAKRSRRKRVE